MSDTEELKRMLRELMSEGRNPSAGSASAGNADNRSYRERMDDLIKSSKEAGDSFKKLNGGLRLTNRAQYEHRVAMQEAQSELYDLEVALRKHRKGTDLLTDSQLKAVEARRKELSGMMQQGQGMEKFTAGVEKWGKFLIGYYGAVQQATLQGIGQVLSTVQSGGSGFAIANAQMAMQLDVANVHAQQLANATQMAGASVAMIPGFASKLVGLGMVLSAEARKTASQLQTDAKKMFNNLLMAGGDQLLKAYEGLTKGGVLLAGGANDMRKALTADGRMQITFQTFERMVQNSAELLADSNLGVGKASYMMGQVAARLKSAGVDRAFQALGISLEDTGPLIAQVMKDFARAGRRLTAADTPEVQQRTIEYAKNLALLSQLSGKTVKEEMAKRAAAQSEFGYRAKMAQLGERANAEQAQVMEGLTANTRAAVVELERFGFIKNEDVRNMAQLIPEFGEYLNSMAREFGSGNLSIKRELELRQKMGPALQNSLKNNPLLADLAVARTKLEAPLNSFIAEYDRTMRSSEETVKETIGVINERYRKGLASVEPGNLDQTLLYMKAIGEEFQARFQENIIDRIPQIAGLLKTALDDAKKLLETGPTVNTGALEATANLMEKLALLMAGVMALELAVKAIRAMLPKTTPEPTPTTTESARTAEAARTTSGPKAMTHAEQRAAEAGLRPSERQRLRAEQSALRAAEREAAEVAARESAELAKQTARNAKIVKYAKIANRTVAAAQVLSYGYEMNEIRERKEKGEIDERQANAEYTGKTVETAGGLVASMIGAKIGAGIGAGIGAFFAGVGAVPGAAVGGLLGAIFGGAVYYLTKASDWFNSIGQRASKWWQDSKITERITGIWDRIGTTVSSITGWIGEKFSWDNIKNTFSFGTSSSAPSKPSSGTPAAPVAVPTTVSGTLPKGLTSRNNALVVALAQDDGNWISLSTAGQVQMRDMMTQALKSSLGGAGSLGTTNYGTGFYKPKLDPRGKAVTEADFAEIGKGDPVVYALGKLTKIAAEEADIMRSLATKMGASLDTQGDSKRYLRNMANAFR